MSAAWWNKMSINHNVKVYEQSATAQTFDQIVNLITAGEVEIGSLMPNIYDLSEHLGFRSSYSVRRAYHQLAERGLIEHSSKNKVRQYGERTIYSAGWVCCGQKPTAPPEPVAKPQPTSTDRIESIVLEIIELYRTLSVLLDDLCKNPNPAWANPRAINSLLQMYKSKSIEKITRLTDNIGDIVQVIRTQPDY